MSAWLSVGLPALSASVAVLEADTVLVGQWLVSRPLVVGPLVGWLAGDPVLGAGLGALVEVFCLEELPVGSVMPPNGAVAAATAVLLSAGPSGIPPALSLPVGLALGALHGRVEARVRSWRAALTARALEAVVTEGVVPWRRLWARSVGVHLAATALFVYAAVALLGPTLDRALTWLPGSVSPGLERVWQAAPFLALGSLLQRLSR
ncbi:hypothetical protein EPO15_06610 [bacterium]|nr:MAG: hypothetical protein EPO15_06610 [bacterium]